MNDSYAMEAPTGFGDDFLLGRVGAERKFYANGAPRELPPPMANRQELKVSRGFPAVADAECAVFGVSEAPALPAACAGLAISSDGFVGERRVKLTTLVVIS
jgi:hypothetical protein